MAATTTTRKRTDKATTEPATRKPAAREAAAKATATNVPMKGQPDGTVTNERGLTAKQIMFLDAWAANPGLTLDQVCDLTGIGGKVPANRLEFAMRLVQRGALVLTVMAPTAAR
jgi:hypothetical protein